MPGTVSFIRQSFPGKPLFTGENVPDLKQKVAIVTGSNTGMGKELTQTLYSKNAKVYMMARSEEKTQKAIQDIQNAVPTSDGQLIFLPLDLSDLDSFRTSARNFLDQEKNLHLLFNNAGVGYPEAGSKSKQGFELQLGVNCVGTFAFTEHLTPILVSTAKRSPPNSVRVVWCCSSAAEAIAPQGFMEAVQDVEKRSSFDQYCISKLGNYLHAVEYAARHKADGIISLPINPGNLDSDFWRTSGSWTTWILQKTLLYPPVYGAYTALFAGFSPEVTLEKSGTFVIAPWGKFWTMSKELVAATQNKSSGGTGLAQQFWDWTDTQVKAH